MAAELPDTPPETVEDFSGGWNTNTVPDKLPPNTSPVIYNMKVDKKRGAGKTRDGFDTVVTTNTLSKINFIARIEKSSGDICFVVSDSSITLGTIDFVTFTTLRTTQTATAVLNFTQVRDKGWFSNGSDEVWTYDCSTVTVLDGKTYSGLVTPNVPRGKFLEFDQERVWVYNSTDSPSRLYFSALTDTNAVAITPDDFRAWPVTNALDVGQGDGDVGTGLFVLQRQLHATKQRSIFTRFGTDEFTYYMRRTNSKNGAASDDSIAIGDNLAYMQDRDGIHAFDGDQSVRISDDIKDEILKRDRKHR